MNKPPEIKWDQGRVSNFREIYDWALCNDPVLARADRAAGNWCLDLDQRYEAVIAILLQVKAATEAKMLADAMTRPPTPFIAKCE